MERNFDRVGLQLENLRDLARAEVGAVAKGDQLAIARAQRFNRPMEVQPRDRVLRNVSWRSDIWHLEDLATNTGEVHADLSACDPDQPGDGLAAPFVEAGPVAERAFERGRGDVLGIDAVTNAIRDIGVHAFDERLEITQRIAA